MEGTKRESRSEGVPVAAVEKPAEKKPPSYTVGCIDDFISPSLNPLSYDCSGEGRREEVWASTGVVEGPSLVGRTEVLGTPSVIPSNYDCFGEGLPQEGQEERAKFSGSQCAQRSLNPCAPEFISRRSPENQEKIKKTFPSRIFTPSLRPTEERRPPRRKAGMPPKYDDYILGQPKKGVRIIRRRVLPLVT